MASLMAAVDDGGALRLRWTLEALEQALAQDSLDPDGHYEILNGELYRKIGQDWPHSFALSALIRVFTRAVDESPAYVSAQQPVRVGSDAPEPDLAVISGPLDARQGHPEASDTLLVVEVAASSILRDRSIKAPIYAAGRAPVYWIVDLNASQVEVYTRPASGMYSEVRVFSYADELPIPFPGGPVVQVKDLIAPEP